eukprot:CAMPEP_0114426234 /NCGR_PEP_ID=MMETSP0103-20121206/7681_1 /TAXON_ID=37642 ORGANISM="Paraphysomonas imperforata, Strain PA2" /NCGR_SAMPLE_ID=MMETSP0103 /ASSEMBLY_ACC=CAM_ASM_000201 /LENGTH=849 /DNA_ID=CAMNT_0001595165 /DNA_START=186 /DNA_END=2735 /DNA_ORIENTATION=-
MGCSNSKSADEDNFEFVSNNHADGSGHSPHKQGGHSAQEKVYRNYTEQQKPASVCSDSGDTDMSEPPHQHIGSTNSDEEAHDSSHIQLHVSSGNAKLDNEGLTSEEEQLSPPVPTSRAKAKKTPDEKSNSTRTGESPGQDEDFMTPVIMGHGNNSYRSRNQQQQQNGSHLSGKKDNHRDPPVTAKNNIPDIPPASVETQLKAIVRMQKLFRQRKEWKRVIEEREWKIFNDLDTQDEADMLNLASFMQTLLDWNTQTNDDGSDNFDSPSQKALVQQDSDTEDYPSTAKARMKRDVSVRTAQLNSVSVHSSHQVYGNSDDFSIPKGPLNSKVAKDIISVYKNKGHLSLKSIQKILRFSYKNFKKLSTMSHIHIEKGEKVTVVGDLHGQLGDLFHILEESGWPSPTNKYIFNGDFVDRGEQGVEVVCVLLSLFAAMPESVYMNRGNHEDHAICCVYGFEKEVKEKYDELTFGMFVEIFRHIPLFTLINDEIFVVHGGLFHDVNVSLADLADIDRTDYSAKPPVPYPECCDGLGTAESRKEYLKQLQRDALWSDPNEFEVLSKNSRGSGVVFGPEVTRRFLKNNKLNMIVRSHECVRRGFDQPFSGAFKNLLCTVFSASNYCGGHNDASYMTFSCHAMSNGHAISHSRSNMQYNVHHFNLSDAKQSLKAANHDNIREMILRKGKALQQAFETVDVSCSKTVTMSQWSEIMQRVTNLKILWLTILKELSPECINGNHIHYALFLKSLKKTVEDTNSITVDSLYGQRQKLETIFHFFDKNGDGTISREEFRKGCDFMNTTLPPDQQLKDYDHILTLMDFDQSDSIDINEFFEVFRILDAKDGVVDGVISLAAKVK